MPTLTLPPPEISPPPIYLEIGGHLGMAARADEPPDLEAVDRVGLDLAASVLVTPAPAFSVGLTFQQLDLGRERSATSGLGSFEVDRDMSALWAVLRLNLAGERGGLGLDLGPGLAWQRVEVNGVVGLLDRPTTFTCGGSDSARLGLRAGVSGWIGAGAGFALSARAGAEALQLSSGVLDGCAGGAGSALMMGLSLGITWRADVRTYVR